MEFTIMAQLPNKELSTLNSGKGGSWKLSEISVGNTEKNQLLSRPQKKSWQWIKFNLSVMPKYIYPNPACLYIKSLYLGVKKIW